MPASTQELEQRIDILRVRCEEITKALDAVNKLTMAQTQQRLEDNAHYCALRSIVSEIALRLGLSRDQFWQQYDARYSYYRDQILQQAETSKPQLAAQMDGRTIADVPTERFAPLFPPGG